MDPAAFPSAEILVFVPDGDKTVCAALVRYREAKPHHRGEALF